MREIRHQGNFPVGVFRNPGLTLRVGRGVKIIEVWDQGRGKWVKLRRRNTWHPRVWPLSLPNPLIILFKWITEWRDRGMSGRRGGGKEGDKQGVGEESKILRLLGNWRKTHFKVGFYLTCDKAELLRMSHSLGCWPQSKAPVLACSNWSSIQTVMLRMVIPYSVMYHLVYCL